MQRVVIIDYGSGNLHSAVKAFERAAHESGADAKIVLSAAAKDVDSADRVVLPGVGAFADASAASMRFRGCVAALEETVREKGRPFLGICVGMQLMATRGLEFEVTDGLGWIPGEVRAIEPNDPALKIPHMGWNTLDVANPHALLDGIATGPQGLHAYFVHSFHLVTAERSSIVGRDGLWRAGDGDRRQGQHRRHAVSSRKEPEARAQAHRQFPEVDALALASPNNFLTAGLRATGTSGVARCHGHSASKLGVTP